MFRTMAGQPSPKKIYEEVKKELFDQYIQIKDRQIIAGQTSGGIWYCKELPADNPEELKKLIGEVNKILNNYNTKTVKNRTVKTKTDVKGLK